MSDPLTFIASIAPLQSAITIASDGGARVKIDIPESEMGKIHKLMGLRGQVLKVSVQIVKQKAQTRASDEWGDDTDEDT